MENSVRSLSPGSLWNHFADLNAVPRPSKKEERVIAFMRNFGEGLGLDTEVDAVGNVIIRKPASPGMENRATVCLQSHLDMVHQKNADTVFDFDTQGIEMYVDGDWVKARGTTLGADNGIGVAAIMAVLSSNDIAHPPLEALFTIDEETGMTGAVGLEGGILHARYLLNLDTEEDTELTIGCAGGINVAGSGTYAETANSELSGHVAFRIQVKGLVGGHSGMEIHLGRGNANKLMNRLLYGGVENHGWRIHSIDGGGLRNAIPRESTAVVVLPASEAEASAQYVERCAADIRAEYARTDPALRVEWEAAEMPAGVADKDFTRQLLDTIYASLSGIYRMSPDMPGLVQSSNNLARVQVNDGQYSLLCLTRSSVESEKAEVVRSLRSAFQIEGLAFATSGSYPGWTPQPESEIVDLMAAQYKSVFGEAPRISAGHGGLECGILGRNYPDMQMISFGPNIFGAHSPDERAQISSVQKFWDLLLETLRNIPENA